MQMEKQALERLRDAESLIGTPTTKMFADKFAPEGRLEWLESVREILKANGIEPENLGGPWRTP